MIESLDEKQSDPWAAQPWRLGTQCSEMFEEVAQSSELTLALSLQFLKLS